MQSGSVRGIACLVVVLLLSACDGGDVNAPAVPSPPAAAIQDGPNGGPYAGFAFLPPLVPAPGLGGQSPLAGLAPWVEVCELDTGVSPWSCEAVFRTFGPDEVDYEGHQYRVDWRTNDPHDPVAVYSQSDPTTYRVTVYLGTRALGFLDVRFGATGGAAHQLTGGGVIGLHAGRTVPLQFFLGSGLEDDICGAGYDCRVATAYPGQDNLFVTRDGDAELFIPAGALPGSEPYLVTIHEKDDASCDFEFPADLPHGATLPDYGACYEYLLDPDPIMLAPIVVGQCIDEGSVPAGHRPELQLGAWHNGDPQFRAPGVPEYELLPNVSLPQALTCDDYVPGPNPSGALALVRKATRGVISLVLGEPAYAGHTGLGGRALEKSIVKWVDPGLRVAGFSEARGGASSIRSVALAPALQSLVDTYGYVWRDTASVLTASLFDGDVDVAILGSVFNPYHVIDALSAAEQDALADYVEQGGCALLLADNDTHEGAVTDGVNESLVDAFGLDLDGTLTGPRTATVTPAGATHPATAGVTTFTQMGPGWFDGTGQATVLATNSAGPAMVTVPGDQGAWGESGPVFAFSDVQQFFGHASSGAFENPSNRQLFLQTVAACGTEPAPVP